DFFFSDTDLNTHNTLLSLWLCTGVIFVCMDNQCQFLILFMGHQWGMYGTLFIGEIRRSSSTW
ncbi:TPA: hypothetical protein J9610_RS03360, partial [Escherichia coli]